MSPSLDRFFVTCIVHLHAIAGCNRRGQKLVIRYCADRQTVQMTAVAAIDQL